MQNANNGGANNADAAPADGAEDAAADNHGDQAAAVNEEPINQGEVQAGEAEEGNVEEEEGVNEANNAAQGGCCNLEWTLPIVKHRTCCSCDISHTFEKLSSGKLLYAPKIWQVESTRRVLLHVWALGSQNV